MDLGFLQTIISFLILLSIVVFVHEWGHFYIARRNGVRVEVFSVGFGPEIFGWYDKYGTRWRVSAVPLGGYVKMFGMAEDEEINDKSAQNFLESGANTNADADGVMSEDEKAVSFAHKSVGQRAAIVFAGPAINFIFAVIVLAGIGLAVGVPNISVSVEEVTAGSAAEAGGMQNGDVLLQIDGKEVTDARTVQKIVTANPGVELPFVVSRDGQEVQLNVTPANADDGQGNQSGRLGIRMQSALLSYERLNPFAAAWFGLEKTASITWEALVNIGNLLTLQGNFKDLGGPIAIAQMSGQAAEQGILPFVFLMAVISINLGLINLFPIPILDGGHLMFMGIEAVRGKPLGERAQEYGFRIGLALVLLLMVSVTWNDLVRSFGF